MVAGSSRIQPLSIFLIKDGQAQCLKPGLKQITVEMGDKRGKRLGVLHVLQNPKKPPKWLEFFEGTLQRQKLDLFNASNGAVLVVKQGGRTFAVAFGHGRYLLEPGSWEENFGLRVTLNSVDPQRLKSVDRRTFDAYSCHTRTQVSQEGDVTAFGLNIEQDLLRAATGQPIDTALGTRMTGMDSLLVGARVKLANLHDLLGAYLGKFEDDAYKKAFPWVDHIAEVRDQKLRADLDADLLGLIRSGDLSDTPAWLAVPDLIEWADIAGFRYRTSRDADTFPDLHIRDFLTTVDDRRTLDIETLKHRHAYATGVADDATIRKWTIYACLYGELDRDETTYLLSGGKWYRVERDFVKGVNGSVRKLVRKTAFPDYDDKSEGEYNRRVARSSKGKTALLDCKLVRSGGSPIEFCDLLTDDGKIIHVKRYGGSSVLSHLFAQGSVSANVFLQDEAFRTALNAKLPRSHRIAEPSQRPEPKDYEVVYAIVSRSQKPIDQALPFFSRLNLRNAATQLRGFGYKVSLVKIAHA